MSYKMALEIMERKAKEREKKLAKKHEKQKGYARSSMPAIKDGTVKRGKS